MDLCFCDGLNETCMTVIPYLLKLTHCGLTFYNHIFLPLLKHSILQIMIQNIFNKIRYSCELWICEYWVAKNSCRIVFSLPFMLVFPPNQTQFFVCLLLSICVISYRKSWAMLINIKAIFPDLGIPMLTHWGRVTHTCVGKLTTIGSDNGLSPGRRQAIIWTIAGILLIGPLGTNFSEILIGIQTFSFKKMHLKMLSAKWRPFVSASMC